MQIDKEGAQPERVKQELAENGLLPEEWGGETAVVAVPSFFMSHREQVPYVGLTICPAVVRPSDMYTATTSLVLWSMLYI